MCQRAARTACAGARVVMLAALTVMRGAATRAGCIVGHDGGVRGVDGAGNIKGT